MHTNESNSFILLIDFAILYILTLVKTLFNLDKILLHWLLHSI